MLRETPTYVALLTVSEVAALAGVSVRTLHHYDEIGVLAPLARSEAGYRLYSPADVTRLREILTWRRLDVPLRQIPQLLEATGADRRAILEDQRARIGDRIDELEQLADALDRAISITEADIVDTNQDIIDALGGFDPAEHGDETRQRWGHTDSYRESARRTKQYTPEQWRTIRAEAEDLTEDLAALFDEGVDPASQVAVAASEAWRLHVGRWFYDLTPDMQRNLGEMYVEDPRFTAHYDGPEDERAGFAAWMRDAFAANAEAAREG
ncbi:MAG: transcriptional regulator [Thermoleophilia bacterium]|nr:transcriptional regulator [Thermoleophilia bacterium]MCZ4496020.1 transcriptional regulator [Thermoleophilia bacterium]